MWSGGKWVWLAIGAGMIGAMATAGCGKPQVAPENLRITMSLRTAVSARNSDWLENNAQLIEDRRASGEINDREYGAFRQILDDARGGEWKKAEKAIVRLQTTQRPDRLTTRLPHPDNH